MTPFRTALPAANEETRRALHGGAIFHLGPTAASERLVDAALAALADELGPGDVRAAHARLGDEAHFRVIGRVRKRLFCEPRFHRAVREVIAACGFEPRRCAFDPIRLRVVVHRGHDNPRAAPVYYPHRDTWYAHPQAVVAWWIPLHDLPAEQTFVFYPERFRRPVANGSARFEYGAWVRDGWDLKIGWQDRDAGLEAEYPAAATALDAGAEVGFACRRGDNLLFSGAHFHRTLPHAAGVTRYSLDFRVVDLDDHARGAGAPNVDNRSRGSALVDYVGPEAP
jgi:hypothetical protein